MSWDVMVMKFEGARPTVEELENGDAIPIALGPGDKVRKAITKSLPDVDWSDPTWGTYTGDGFSIEFNAGAALIYDLMLHVRGGGNAIDAIMKFATPNGWSVLDCSTDQFLDPQNPSQEGWEGFQKFRDKVVKKVTKKKKPGRR